MITHSLNLELARANRRLTDVASDLRIARDRMRSARADVLSFQAEIAKAKGAPLTRMDKAGLVAFAVMVIGMAGAACLVDIWWWWWM